MAAEHDIYRSHCAAAVVKLAAQISSQMRHEDFLVEVSHICELGLPENFYSLLREDRRQWDDARRSAVKRTLGEEKKVVTLVAGFRLVAVRGCWLGVWCENCDTKYSKTRGGCFGCCLLREELDELLADSDFMAGLRTVREHLDADAPKCVLADWLEERGHLALAELFRRKGSAA